MLVIIFLYLYTYINVIQLYLLKFEIIAFSSILETIKKVGTEYNNILITNQLNWFQIMKILSVRR